MGIGYWWLAAMMAAAAWAGVCIGRFQGRKNRIYEDGDDGKEASHREETRKEASYRETGSTGITVRRRREKKDAGRDTAYRVGSPVSGEVTSMQEGEIPAIVIHPSEDRLYAPTGGKITKLFPMGNAFLFSTEFGAELFIQAGDTEDELLGRYYRPRIVQNEIVPKGKLLLEFDREGLESEGKAPEVLVSVRTRVQENNILATAGGQIKTGEEIFSFQGNV